MEFDHYEALVKKLKDINCFYNEIYQDWKDWRIMDWKLSQSIKRALIFNGKMEKRNQ